MILKEEQQRAEVETVHNDTLEEDKDRPPTLEEVEQNEKWYKKASLILDHVNEFSKTVYEYPGFNLSIDEMMKLFKDRSHQTVQMRCKPIKEGFMFYALCDSTTGFVYYFIPDGLKVKYKGIVVDSVVEMVKTLPDKDNKIYVVVMDNYFTYGSTLKRCREKGVGLFGTARATQV